MDAASDPTLDTLFLRLPRELRDLVYAYILGDVEDEDEYNSIRRCSPFEIIRRIPQPEPVQIEEKLRLHRDPNYHFPRCRLFRGTGPDAQAWLESCVRRLAQMNRSLVEEFMHYYFRNVILDLKGEQPYSWDDNTFHVGVSPGSRQHWLKLNTKFHPFIRQISLDIHYEERAYCCPEIRRYDGECPYASDRFLGTCRTISRNLELDTLILWIFLNRAEADHFFAGRVPPELWTKRIQVVRKMRVRNNFEIHTSIGLRGGSGDYVLLDDPYRCPEERKLVLAEFKKLDEILYPLLLPDTLRDTTLADNAMGEYLGVSELFEEKEEQEED